MMTNEDSIQGDDDKEGNKMRGAVSEVKNRKTSTAVLLENLTQKEGISNCNKNTMADDQEKEEKTIWSAHNMVKSKVVSTASLEKMKEKLCNAHNEKKMQIGDDEGNIETTAFCEGEKRKKSPNKTNAQKETVPFTTASKGKRMRPSESMEMMMRHDKPNWRNVPSSVCVSKEKMDTSSGSYYKKRKREEPHTSSKKEKRILCNASDKIHSGRVQEKKVCSGGKEKNSHAPFGFIKFICNNFNEFLLIPPAVAPKLKDLTNCHVYLEDSAGGHLKVRLSALDGRLAFREGWNIFVSDHLIKWGEFLLFEYIGKKTFSVRVFGIDSRERLYFEKDPKSVEHGVGSGPAARQNNNGNLINQQFKTKGTSPLRRKGKTLIVISDSGASTDNEGIVSLTTSDADSTHHVAINTDKDSKRVQYGIGNLPDGECGTKCITPTYGDGKTSSEIIATGAAPLMHENEDRVGHGLEILDLDEGLIRKQGINSIPLDSITAVVKHQNHSKMNTSQTFCRKYEAPGGFRCLEKWKKGMVNTRGVLDGIVQFEPENTQKTDSKLVDGCGLIGVNTASEYFSSEGNHTCVPSLFSMLVKEPSSDDGVSKCRHGGTEIGHSIKEKGGGDDVELETQGEQSEPARSIVNSRRKNIPVPTNVVIPGEYSGLGLNPFEAEGTCAFVDSLLTVPAEKPSNPDAISKFESSRAEINHTVNGKEHCFSKHEGIKSINCAIPESLLPNNDKILELDDHSLLKFSLQLCIPDATRTWLELPKSLSDGVKQKRHNQNVILLKDPMKRLWPVLYHENPVFVGFTAGWNHFIAGNNLQTGDFCNLIKEPDDDEPVYSVLITRH